MVALPRAGGRMVFLLMALALAAAACTTSDNPLVDTEPGATATTVAIAGDQDEGDAGEDEGGVDEDEGDDDGDAGPVETPGEIPPLRQGLAQLDSYRLAMSINAEGSDFEQTAAEIAVEYSRGDDAWRQTVSEAGVVTSETIWVAGVACNFDGEFWTPTEFAVQDRDFFGVFWNQMDIVPVVANPVLVGEEEYSGVPADRYTFTVPALGLESGAVPSESTGEYWVAKDGYLVGFRVALETSTGPPDDPTTETVGGELLIDVTDINQPISIQAPPECAPTAAAPPPAGIPAGPIDSDVPRPPPLRRSLGQLDSYRMTMGLAFGSPSLGSSDVSAQFEIGEGGWHQVLSATAEGETSTTEVYWTSDLVCSFDGEEWSPAELDEQEREVLGVLLNQIDFVPAVTDPVEVGEEDFEGVPATHYTFTVAGLTSDTANTSGEYWLAQDGGYLLGYRLELASGSGAEAAGGTLSITLRDVNAPVAIEPPADCALPPPGEEPATTEAPATTESAAGDFDADVAAILDLWDRYSISWLEGNEAAVQFILDNTYPGFGGTFPDCFDVVFPDGPEPGYGIAAFVDTASIFPDDGWVLEGGPFAGTVPEGRIYGMTVEFTEYWLDRDPSVNEALVHVTLLPEPRFFILCPG